jgi:hypothetical protein
MIQNEPKMPIPDQDEAILEVSDVVPHHKKVSKNKLGKKLPGGYS